MPLLAKAGVELALCSSSLLFLGHAHATQTGGSTMREPERDCLGEVTRTSSFCRCGGWREWHLLEEEEEEEEEEETKDGGTCVTTLREF